MSRTSAIDASLHREEYRQLMLEGWSSYQLERYAREVYKERIGSNVFRKYIQRKLSAHPDYKRRRSNLEEVVEGVSGRGIPELPDVLKVKATILEMQLSRIAMYWQKELETFSEKKLDEAMKLGMKVAKVLEVTLAVVDRIEQTYQDLGIYPKAAERIEVATDKKRSFWDLTLEEQREYVRRELPKIERLVQVVKGQAGSSNLGLGEQSTTPP